MPIEPELVAKPGKPRPEPLSADSLQSVAGGGGLQIADGKGTGGVKGTASGVSSTAPGGLKPGPGADNGDGLADLVVGSTPSQPRRP